MTEATIQPDNNSRYEYDNIGNNLWVTINAATNTYTANALNQYTSILCAPAPLREPSYDLDGNLVTNGVWSYTWDGENRLKAVYSNSACVVSNAYDHQSRRVLKITPTATHTFVYDGWNLIAELTHTQTHTLTNFYIWGKDLSGTLQGAGGVGGLLAVHIDSAWYFTCYDNNGNITAYVDESGTLVAEYTYDAFGRTIASSGPMADILPYRFSTKYYDTETGLCYYGYRFYSPELGRWLSRDPIGEFGGDNLFLFCDNNSLVRIDYLGFAGHILIAAIETGEHQGLKLGKTAWIEYVPDCDRTFSFGVTIKKNVLYNLHNYGNANGPEKRLGVNQSNLHDTSATHTRMAHIGDDAEEKLWQYLKQQRDLGSVAWNYLHNCAGFAAVAWKTATDELLDPAHGKTVGGEISDKQLDDYLDGIGVPKQLQNIVNPIIKVLPMVTPKNLADSIWDANGGNRSGWKK